MTKPLALVVYEKLLPGSQLVNRLQDLGYRVQTITDATTLTACAEQEKPLLALVDLKAKRTKVPDEVAKLRANPATNHVPVIAFADEKDAGLQTAGRGAGATLVVSDSALLTHLEQFIDQALLLD